LIIQYLAKVKETKDIKPHAKQYKVYHVECPFCHYTCEVHAVDQWGAQNIYTKCNICKKSLVKREKKSRLQK
jgi:hypothetical protein